jgi:LmbE family N-acetylglucosaminyl deacetylase
VSDHAVLHLSPHPDDELLGAPATLMALRDAGWRVVNLACGLGAPEQHRRREGELREACHRAGFELLLPEPPPPLSGDGDPAAAHAALAEAIAAAVDEVKPGVVVSPGPGDRHPTHELDALAAAEVLGECGAEAPRQWLWALWGAPPRPTLATGFDRGRLDEILHALEAHSGELERNDYARLVRARAEASACLAPELLFGFGSEAAPGPAFAELLTEVLPGEEGPGAPRWLDPAAPL